MTNNMNSIAIIGVGAIFPGSCDAKGFWRDIILGKDLISDVPPSRWLIDDYYDKNPAAEDKTYCKRGGFIPDIAFDPLEFGVPPNIVPATDTTQLLALIVAKQVLKDACQGNYANVDLSRTNVILGVTSAQELLITMASRLQRPIWAKGLRDCGISEDQVQKVCDAIACSYVPWQESTFPGLLGNVVAGRIANRFNLGGTNCVTDAACASSLSAFAMGINELLLGQADLSIVGGADTLNDIFMYMCFSKTPAFSFTGDCRPFSDKSDGTLIGEGLSLFALKRLEDAENNGDRIYAVIRGLGSSSDGRAKSVFSPVAKGQAQALRRAYEMAGYSPRTVELVEAHGTATKAGDVEEFEGLKTVFQEASPDKKQWCALGSIKSQIGHTKAAAGAASLFKIVMALHHRVLPPTIKVEAPNPQLNIQDSPFYLNTEARPWIENEDHPRRASASSFGFGGSNFHITLEEYQGPKKAFRLRSHPYELILFSGETPEALIKTADKAIGDDLQYLAYDSQKQFNENHAAKLAIIAEDAKDLREKLLQATDWIGKRPKQPFSIANTHYAVGSKKEKIALLFPGQGSQYLRMGVDLAIFFPQSFKVWEAASKIELDPNHRLNDIVFPKAVFTIEEKEKLSSRLAQALWSQPSIATMSFSQLAILKDLGIKADCLAGHSFGEITALAASGVFDFQTLLKIARRRGELLTKATPVAGTMTAVFYPIEQLTPMLEAWKIPVTTANFNSPSELVLSGSIPAIQEVEQKLLEAKIKFFRLPVSNAFHSEMMRPASESYDQFLNELKITPPSIPVYSNAYADPYTSDLALIKKNLVDQLTHPVRFIEEIEKMHQSGVRIFIEVGPGSILTGLVQQILREKDFQAIALDRKDEPGLKIFLNAIGQMSVHGVKCNFDVLWKDYAPIEPPSKEIKHKILINGSNYGKPYPPVGGGQKIMKEPTPPKKEVTEKPQTTPPKEEKEHPFISSNRQEILAFYERFQESISRAHDEYQRDTAECHKAFLHLVETTLHEFRELSKGEAVVYPIKKTEEPQKVRDVSSNPIQVEQPPALEPILEQSIPKKEIQPEQQPIAPLKPVSSLQKIILEVVADKTGYPVDMLSLEMELEADLGIDSIKRVEILSGIQEASPGLPELDPNQLAALKTLKQIVQYLEKTPTETVIEKPIPQKTASSLQKTILEVVADKTGYPVDMLSLEMELEADLGIDSIKRVEILSGIQEASPGLPELDPSQLAALKTLRQIVQYLEETPSAIKKKDLK